MKILTLNTWGGRSGKENLLHFLKEKSMDVDVFCLQEIWSAPYEHLEKKSAGGLAIQHDNIMVYGMQDISKILSDYEYYFHPHHLENYGLMMLVRRGLYVEGFGDVFVHKERGFIPQGDVGHHARNIQYVTLKRDHSVCTVINFHGLWNGKGKTDSEERLDQSRKIIDFICGLSGEVILCGDFNLLPNTESIKIIENAGFRNLISDYGITSTRTSFYKKSDKFADYIFVNENVVVKDFKALSEEVSDHSPLCIEIE